MARKSAVTSSPCWPSRSGMQFFLASTHEAGPVRRPSMRRWRGVTPEEVARGGIEGMKRRWRRGKHCILMMKTRSCSWRHSSRPTALTGNTWPRGRNLCNRSGG